MERLLLIALVGSVTAVLLRTVRTEYAVIVGIVTAVLLLVLGIGSLTGIAGVFERACTEFGVSSALLASALKILGLAYLTDLGVNISRDAGQQAIAGNLELGGRILIVSCALPSIVSLLETGAGLIREALT